MSYESPYRYTLSKIQPIISKTYLVKGFLDVHKYIKFKA